MLALKNLVGKQANLTVRPPTSVGIARTTPARRPHQDDNPQQPSLGRHHGRGRGGGISGICQAAKRRDAWSPPLTLPPQAAPGKPMGLRGFQEGLPGNQARPLTRLLVSERRGQNSLGAA